MNLQISITDENGDVLRAVEIYKDGSDSEAADTIMDLIRVQFADDVDEDDDETIIELPNDVS